MERLTFLNGDEVPCVCEDKCYEGQSGHYCGPAIDRLAAYEDTGLMPNDVTDMMAANGNAISTIAEQKKALSDLRNELCQRCGKYRQAHEGACDGCRWKQ